MRHTLLTLAGAATLLLTFALAACTLAACADAPRTSFSLMRVEVKPGGVPLAVPFTAQILDVGGATAYSIDCYASPCYAPAGELVGTARAYHVMAFWADSTGATAYALTDRFNPPDLADTLTVTGEGIRVEFTP